MKFLLDTHAYVWGRISPELLPSNTSGLMADPDTDLLISVVTPWEIAIKGGKQPFPAAALLTDFERREVAAGYAIATITIRQVIRSGLLPSHHRDPFDRLLVAQALDLQIPIISKDKVLDLYGVQRIWD